MLLLFCCCYLLILGYLFCSVHHHFVHHMATRLLALLPTGNGSFSGAEAYLAGSEEISAKINWVDYLAIGIYFAMIIVVGIVVSGL